MELSQRNRGVTWTSYAYRAKTEIFRVGLIKLEMINYVIYASAKSMSFTAMTKPSIPHLQFLSCIVLRENHKTP